MKRKYKRRTSRFGIFFVFLTAVTIAGVFFIPWAMKGSVKYFSQNGLQGLA